jgi:hypothetical protein
MQRNPQSSGRERVRGGQRLDLKGTRLDEHAPVGARGAPRNHVLSASDASRPEPDTTWSPRRGACAPGQKHHVGAPRADFCTRACARSGPSRELATLKRLVARPAQATDRGADVADREAPPAASLTARPPPGAPPPANRMLPTRSASILTARRIDSFLIPPDHAAPHEPLRRIRPARQPRDSETAPTTAHAAPASSTGAPRRTRRTSTPVTPAPGPSARDTAGCHVGDLTLPRWRRYDWPTGGAVGRCLFFLLFSGGRPCV